MIVNGSLLKIDNQIPILTEKDDEESIKSQPKIKEKAPEARRKPATDTESVNTNREDEPAIQKQYSKKDTVSKKQTAKKNTNPIKKKDAVSQNKSVKEKAAAKKTVSHKVAPAAYVPDQHKEMAPNQANTGKAKPTARRGNMDPKTRWKAVQAKRRASLRMACERLDNVEHRNISQMIKTSKRSFWPFIVEDRYRLLYTYISKVASTNWKSAFLVLQGKYKKVEDVPGRSAHAQSLVKLSSLPDKDIKQRLDKYTNFIFVRHPFARVLSAYRSKFLQPNKSFQKHAGVRIIKAYRPNATEEALKTGSDVTFPEFVRYLANSKFIHFDGHWQPIYKMVLPCTVRFDFIGKLETGEEDGRYILEETHVDHLVHFMDTQRNASHDDSIFNHFYSQVPRGDLVKLYKVYEPDFQLFGYQIPDIVNKIIKMY